MTKNKKPISLQEGLQRIEQILLTSHKDSHEGLCADATWKHQRTGCSICKADQGVVAEGLGPRGLRYLVTIDEGKVSYFICRQCLKVHQLVG